MFIVSMLAAGLVAAVLVLLAGVHGYWACGGAWPARTPAELGPMVVGTRPGAAMPGPLACVLVIGALATGAGLVAWAGLGGGWLARLGSAGVGVVLGLRGLLGFVDGRVRPATRGQPFYALNRRIYSPLCLLLAALIGVVLM